MTRKFLYTEANGDYIETAGAYEASDHINVSAGAGDAGKPIVLDAGGQIDASMINDADIDHGNLSGLGDDDHSQYILVAGTRAFTGNQSLGGFKITNMADGVADSDAVNYGQLQAAINGFDWKNSIKVATIAALPSVTYANGSGGVGATLTATANGALPAIDGITLVNTNSILVKDQAAGLQNGLYLVTDVGSAGTPFILTRRIDSDSNAEVTSGLTVAVEDGTVNADRIYQLTTNDPITVGTTALVFTKIVVNALVGGAGVTLTGETFSVDFLTGGGLKFVGAGDAGQLAIEPNDFAGSGLVDDGSDNLAIDWATVPADQKAWKASQLIAVAGASYIGADTTGFTYSTNDTVQEVLADLDAAIAGASTPGVNYVVGVGGVNSGDLVYVSGSNTCRKKDISTSTYGVGLAYTTVAAAGTVKVIDNTVIVGCLTGATPGNRYYWSGTALTSTIPNGGGDSVWLCGVAKNSTDLDVHVEFIKKNV